MSEHVESQRFVQPIASIATTDRPRILIVDDERINRELLKGMLRRNGYELLLASSGEEALETLKQTTPDLVLLDVIMSPLSGFDVLRTIRETHRDTDLPVVMVTAEADRHVIIEAFQSGANDYLTKPLDPEVTLARVSLHLRLRRAQAELERSQERYLMAAEGSRIGLWDWDVVQQQLYLSPRWKEMLGFSDHELAGQINTWFDRIHPNDRGQFFELLRRRNPGEQERFDCELRMLHRDENYRWMQCTGLVISDSVGDPRRLAGSLADITEGKVRDVLTGLPNRLLFEEKVERALQQSRLENGLCAVLFLDLDKFKLVNDSLGHAAGDLLLCGVARRLENCFPQTNRETHGPSTVCISRHGGDEFTVLIQNLSHRQDAEELAKTIIVSLSEQFQLGVHEVSIGVSIGIAFSGPDTGSPLEIIREADTAMYYAKTGGRGQFRTYDPEMQVVAAARLSLENEVRQAVKGDQFFVVYQPIVSLMTGEIDGFEALCRWLHPRGELVGPDTFVPILESLGLISMLGNHVLGIAGQQIRDWNRRLPGRRTRTVTVNCSTSEFAKPDLASDLMKRITEIGVSPRMVRLEVTESTLMGNSETARQVIHELRDYGIGVGLDDFGAGYSSLSYLHRLPLDLLKIDRSFVCSMHQGNESYEIVRTIIALAHGLNLDVIAEGVETSEQHHLLTDLGCTHGQGYFYSKPQSAAEITQLLSSQRSLIPLEQNSVLPSGHSRAVEDIDALLNSLSALTASHAIEVS